MEIISFITDPDVIARILDHLGECTRPPVPAPARSRPPIDFDWEIDDDLSTYFDDEAICYVVTTRHAEGENVLSSNGLVVRRDQVVELARTAKYGRFPSVDFVSWVRKVCSTNRAAVR